MASKTPGTEDFMKLQRDAVDASNRAAAKALDGFQKLAELNMQTARAALEQSTEQIEALLSARDAKTLTELVTSMAKLSPEQFSAYAKAVYAISSETGTDLAALVQQQVGDGNAKLAAAVEALAKAGPGAPPNANEFITQSLNAAKSAYEQMQAAAQQFAQGGGKSGKR
jgi:phasin family protein